jgi:hypothetical protein
MALFNLFLKVFNEKLSANIILAFLVAFKAFYCQLHHCTQFRGRLVYQYVVKCHCSTISKVVGRCQWKFLLPMYFLLLHRCVTSIFDPKILSQNIQKISENRRCIVLLKYQLNNPHEKLDNSGQSIDLEGSKFI